MPEFKKETDGFMKKSSGFKMKGFSGFHGSSPMSRKSKTTSTSVQAEMDAKAVEMGSPLHIGPNLGISADTKTKTEVRAAQDHAAGVVEREEKRADKKERKAKKAASKGKTRKAERKQRKADKIREALAPLKKRRKSDIGNKVTHAEGADSGYKKLAYKKSWGGAGRKTKVVQIDDSAPTRKLEDSKNSLSKQYQKLQEKQKKGTITPAELKKLKKLQTMMETGPGSYGNEQWDKE